MPAYSAKAALKSIITVSIKLIVVVFVENRKITACYRNTFKMTELGDKKMYIQLEYFSRCCASPQEPPIELICKENQKKKLMIMIKVK